MGYAYKIGDGGAVYFTTCTVNKWVDIFTRQIYIDIAVESLNYCVSNKGLIIYGYVIMSNPRRWTGQAGSFASSGQRGKFIRLLRDFKKFTSQTIIRTIEDIKNESRRSCLPVRSGGDAMVV